MNSYKGIITKPMFSKIFRSCRINSLLSKPITALNSEIMGNYMYYTPDGTITVESSTVFLSLLVRANQQNYRNLVKLLNQSLLSSPSQFTLGFRFFHLDGISDELVQLLGAVMSLDTDTIIDIVHNTTTTDVSSLFKAFQIVRHQRRVRLLVLSLALHLRERRNRCGAEPSTIHASRSRVLKAEHR